MNSQQQSKENDAIDEVLAVENMTKRFGSFTVLDEVSFSVSRNGITALIGPNGAGKTTTYNLLTGNLRPTSGKIVFDGEDVTDASVIERVRKGLGRSFQITNIFDELTVRQNLRIPLIAQSGSRFELFEPVADEKSLNSAVDDLLRQLNLVEDAETTIEELPYGAKRRVDLGIALATDPTFVILDEPTTGMTPQETREMVELIRRLDDEMATTFFITEHNMNVVFSLASHVLVLAQGDIIASGSPDEIRQNERVKNAYLGGGSESNVELEYDTKQATPASDVVDALLEIDDIEAFYGKSHILNGLSMQVNEGEIVGLLGRNGAGKTTTLRSIVGHVPPRSGQIRFQGDRIDQLPPHEVSARGIGYVPEEREVFTELTVEENLDLVLDPDSAWSKTDVYDLFPSLEEKSNALGDQISGGQQQMLSIARAILSNPDLLLLDEPSEGLAPVILEDLVPILREISASGMTMLLTEQNTEFAFSLIDRCYLLDNGQIKWSGTSAELRDSPDIIDEYLALSGV